MGVVSGSQGAENESVGECVCQNACNGQVHCWNAGHENTVNRRGVERDEHERCGVLGNEGE